MVASWKNDALRRIPAVEQLLAEPEVQDLIARFGRSQLVEAARTVTSTVRQAILTAVEEEALPSLEYGAFIKRLQNQSETQARPNLTPVINATGVVLHTNLGRAPLAAEACAAVTELPVATAI